MTPVEPIGTRCRRHPQDGNRALPRLNSLAAAFGLAIAVTLAGLGQPASAQSVVSSIDDDGTTIEITAQQGIEWRRDEKVYVAIGNAVARRNDVTVRADRLKAHYRETAGGDNEIYKVEAIGAVKITSTGETVYGEHGVYDIDDKVVRLTGGDLRLVSQDGDVLRARDSLEYHEVEQVAVARGNAIVTSEDQELRADVLIAKLEEDSEGDLRIVQVDGRGNVEVATPEEYGRADRGSYFPERDFATLEQNVRITRGPNQLNGAYAEIDLDSGISKLMASAPGGSGGQRVQGLILPEELETTGKNAEGEAN